MPYFLTGGNGVYYPSRVCSPRFRNKSAPIYPLNSTLRPPAPGRQSYVFNSREIRARSLARRAY